MDILDLGVSGIYCGWGFIVGEHYITFDVGNKSSPVRVSTVGSYWGEIWDVGSLAGRLQFCLLYCYYVNVLVFSQKSKLVDF